MLIGHGTFDGKTTKFNLRGPDVTAADLARWLKPFSRPLVVVDTTSCSAPLINTLSGSNRVVVTATRSGYEENFTHFGHFLAEALSDPEADLDKDHQVSLLEAFLTAARQTAEFYKTEGRIATEHALLDDNGDGLGTPDPDQAISHLSDFAAALRNPEPYFRMLAEHRRVARLLLSLFGTSDFLSKRFLRHPELLDLLLREDQVLLEKSREAFRDEIAERLASIDPALPLDDLLERRLGELRRYKNEEVLRIAVHDIAGTLELASVSTQLTDLAEACLEADIGVPDHVAIVGVNNDDLLCESAWPPISSVTRLFVAASSLSAYRRCGAGGPRFFRNRWRNQV